MMQLKKSTLARVTIALASFSILIGTILWGSQRYLKVTQETLYVPELPPELDGMKILQISDLHANHPERMNLNIWREVKNLDFDLVALTGDIIDKNAYQLEPHMLHLSALAAEKPVFFAEGNHDHYSMKKLSALLTLCGVTILADEKTSFTHNGATFEIIGLNDFYTADLEGQQPLYAPSDTFRLSLVHQPQHVDYFDINASPGVVLSGHTHGGQVRLPLLPTLYAPYQKFFPKYGYGAYDLGRAQMFVSKGIGSTGKMPLRFWNRPEICLLTLRTAN